MINEIEIDTQAIEVMNKAGNQTQIMLSEAFDHLNQISEFIS